MNNDIGGAEGRQVIATDGAQATVLVVRHHAYIRGNALAILNYFRLGKSDSQKFAGKWISIAQKDSEYAPVSAAVTLASDFSQFSTTGRLTEGAVTTIAGQRVIPITLLVGGASGAPKVPATFYVTASGKTLPVEFRASSNAVSEIETWTRWGQRVSIVPPADSIPVSSIHG